MNDEPGRDLAVFAAAVKLPAEEQAAYLARECGDDHSLRARVEALLRANSEAGDFMELSYNSMQDAEGWRPIPYESIHCEAGLSDVTAHVGRGLRWYRAVLPDDTRYHLTGYSLGGVALFEAAGALLFGEPERWQGRIGSVITGHPANRGQWLLRSTEDASTYYVISDWVDEPSFREFERKHLVHSCLERVPHGYLRRPGAACRLHLPLIRYGRPGLARRPARTPAGGLWPCGMGRLRPPLAAGAPRLAPRQHRVLIGCWL